VISPIDLFSLSPTSAMRPPAWRWELARLLTDRRVGRDPVIHADPDVTAAAHMQDLTAVDATTAGQVEAYLSVPQHQADAYVFHSRTRLAGDCDPPKPADPALAEDYPMHGPLTAEAMARAHLEALVLARKSPEAIAKHVGLTPEAVTQYERWWFDVRDRLPRTGWVAHRVIGSLHQGPPHILLPALVRAYGYYTRSTRVVQTVVGAFDPVQARAAGRDPARFFASDAVAAGGLKAALAVRLMPLTRRTYARVMELHHQALEVATKAGQAGGTDEEQKYKTALGELFGKVDHRYRQAPVELPPVAAGPLPRLVEVAEDAG